MPEKARYPIILVIILCGVGVFHFATMRYGHNWNGDTSMYLLQTRQIANGLPSDTRLFVTHATEPLWPKTYPPVFPFMLIPIYKTAGLNLEIMKQFMIVVFLLCLAVLCATFKRFFDRNLALMLTAIVGFHPYFWDFKENILSDIPFLLFLFISLFLIDIIYAAANGRNGKWMLIVMSGIMMYVTYRTRRAGILLVPSLMIFDYIKRKRITKRSMLATAVFVILMMFQDSWFHSIDTILEEFRINSSAIFINLRYYARHYLGTFYKSPFVIPNYILFITTAFMTLFGFLMKIRKQPSIYEVFFLSYLMTILLWPKAHPLRYLFPLIPLFLMYFFHGCNLLMHGCSIRIRQMSTAIIVLAILSGHVERYTHKTFGALSDGVHTHYSQEMFEFLKLNTDSDSVFITRKPRVLHLFTDRNTAMYNRSMGDGELWEFIRNSHATHIIAANIFEDDREYLIPFIIRNSDYIHNVYRNPDFSVYKIVVSETPEIRDREVIAGDFQDIKHQLNKTPL